MAMLTPAQNPRGLASKIFMKLPPDGAYPNLQAGFRQADYNSANDNATPQGSGVERIGSDTHKESARRLVVRDALDLDDILLAFLGEDAGDAALLAFLADVAVVLLVAGGIEEVNHVLLVLLDDEDRGALGETLELQLALGAGDLALE